jgi:predicted MFS family arabinose efflux permease
MNRNPLTVIHKQENRLMLLSGIHHFNFLEGISHLGIVVTAPVVMLILSSEKNHSIVMGLWSSFFGIAFSVTAWAGKPIMELYSVSGPFFVHAMLLFAIFFAAVKIDCACIYIINSIDVRN